MEITDQTKVTELSRIFAQIINFLRETIHVLEQIMAGIKVKYGWEAFADPEETTEG